MDQVAIISHQDIMVGSNHGPIKSTNNKKISVSHGKDPFSYFWSTKIVVQLTWECSLFATLEINML